MYFQKKYAKILIHLSGHKPDSSKAVRSGESADKFDETVFISLALYQGDGSLFRLDSGQGFGISGGEVPRHLFLNGKENSIIRSGNVSF